MMRKRGKSRTWSEAAKIVLEKHPKTPIHHREIFRLIKEESLKDVNESAENPTQCLNASLHANSRGMDSLFYKIQEKPGYYGLMGDLPDGATLCEVDEEGDSGQEGGTQKPVIPGPMPQRTFSEKRKDKVMVVRLAPKPLVPELAPSKISIVPDVVSGSDDMSVCTSNFSVHDESSSNATASISDTLSENYSLDTLSTTSSHEVGRDDIVSVGDNSAQGAAGDTTRLTAATRRRYRNDPIRHYTKRRRKKKPFNRIKQRNQTANRLSVKAKNLSGNERTRSSSTSFVGNHSRRSSTKDVIAKMSGFNFFRSKFRRSQNLGYTSQIRQQRAGCRDLLTPNSCLITMNLRDIINKEAFDQFPPKFQYDLLKLLPPADVTHHPNSTISLSENALNNEFFSKACTEWISRLSEGEFTNETQNRMRMEEDRRKRLDPWKVKHFEAVWGKPSRPNETPASDATHGMAEADSEGASVENIVKAELPNQSKNSGVCAPSTAASDRDVAATDAVQHSDDYVKLLKKDEKMTYSRSVERRVADERLASTANAINVLRELKRSDVASTNREHVPHKRTRIDANVADTFSDGIRNSAPASVSSFKSASSDTVRAVQNSPLSGVVAASQTREQKQVSLSDSEQASPMSKPTGTMPHDSDHTYQAPLRPRAPPVTRGPTILRQTPRHYSQLNVPAPRSSVMFPTSRPTIIAGNQQFRPVAGKTRTLAELKAKNKRKLQPPRFPDRESLMQQVRSVSNSPSDSQLRSHLAASTSMINQQTRSLLQVAEGVNLQRSQQIVQREVLRHQAAGSLVSATTSQLNTDIVSQLNSNVRNLSQLNDALGQAIPTEVQQELFAAPSASAAVNASASVTALRSSTTTTIQSASSLVTSPTQNAVNSTSADQKQLQSVFSHVSQHPSSAAVRAKTTSQATYATTPRFPSRSSSVVMRPSLLSPQVVNQAMTSSLTSTAGVRLPSTSAAPVAASSLANNTRAVGNIAQAAVASQRTPAASVITPQLTQAATTSQQQQVLVIDSKNCQAAGGVTTTSLSTSSFAHQPSQSSDATASATGSVTTTATTSPSDSSSTVKTTMTSSTIRVSVSATVTSVTAVSTMSAAVSQTSAVSAPQITAVVKRNTQVSTVSSGTAVRAPAVTSATVVSNPVTAAVPKLKFIRVKSADGEERYVLSSTSNSVSHNESLTRKTHHKADTKGSASTNSKCVTSIENNVKKIEFSKKSCDVYDFDASNNTPPPSRSSTPSTLSRSPGSSHTGRPPFSASHPSLKKLLAGETLSTNYIGVSPSRHVNSSSLSVKTTSGSVSSNGFGVKPTGGNVSSSANSVKTTSGSVSSSAFSVKTTSGGVSNSAFNVKTTSGSVLSSAFNVKTTSGNVSNSAFNVKNTGVSLLSSALGVKSTVSTGASVLNSAAKRSVPRSAPNSALLQALNNNNSVGGFTSQAIPRAITSTLSSVMSNGHENGKKPVTAFNDTSHCICNKKALVVCKKCGAFCHDDCIGLAQHCVNCLIAT